MDSEDGKKAIQLVLNAKNIFIIIGAGVSVAAGIPAFRGSDGSYNDIDMKLPPGKVVKDIMSAGIKKDATLRQLHCNFIASLAKKAALAKPTVFHNFMSLLNENKVLKRLYTQNIDGLESKAGFEILDDLCIPLHGTLSTLRCETCKFTKPLENYFHFLKAGNIPQCNKDRNSERLRDKTCGGFLYPDILLYEEESPNGDFVAMCANSDSQKIAKTKSSVVLVAGTSLQIPGVVGIIKGMKKAADVKGATLIYIDLNSNLPKALSNIFNLCLQVDCQEFAQAAIDALKGAEGKDRERERIEEDVIVDGQRRRDLRPLWSWI